MKRSILIASLLIVALVAGCGKEDQYNEPEAFSFVVYPGARYLGGLSDATRQAHKITKPNEEPPPVAIYETDDEDARHGSYRDMRMSVRSTTCDVVTSKYGRCTVTRGRFGRGSTSAAR